MLSYPVIPLEERNALLLDLLHQYFSIEVHLNELLLVLVAEDLGQERHIEELMVGVLTCGLALGLSN